MAGRKRKPVHLLQFGDANEVHHLSKKDIELREGCEIHLGGNTIPMPDSVATDPIALKKWHVLAELYDGFKFVTSADADVFEQYCLTYSEWTDLQTSRRDIAKRAKEKGVTSYATSKLLFESKISGQIKACSELLQKLGGKIFLDPVSRVRSIPLPKDKEPKADPLDRFGSI